MSFRILSLSLWLAAFCAAAPCVLAQDSDPLKTAEDLYGRGEFDDASRRVTELMLRESDLEAKDQARLYLLKARLELAFGRKDELKLWLGKARAADPEVHPDPVTDPPQLVEQWESLGNTGHPEQGSPRAGAAGEEGSLLSETRHPQDPKGPSGIRRPEPGSFAVGLLPFGIGHFAADRPRDGALFLATEVLIGLGAHNLSGFEGTDEGSDDRKEAKTSRAFMGGAGLVGAYGYELVSMLPDLAARSAGSTNSLAKHLSLAPFGAAQAKNGHYVSAAVFAGVQSGILLAAGMAPTDGQRRVAMGAFFVSWMYGAYDGYKNHAEGTSTRSSALQILPVVIEDHIGLAVSFRY